MMKFITIFLFCSFVVFADEEIITPTDTETIIEEEVVYLDNENYLEDDKIEDYEEEPILIEPIESIESNGGWL